MKELSSHPAPGPRVLEFSEADEQTRKRLERIRSLASNLRGCFVPFESRREQPWPSNVIALVGPRGGGKTTTLMTAIKGSDGRGDKWLNPRDFYVVESLLTPALLMEGEGFVLPTLATIQHYVEEQIRKRRRPGCEESDEDGYTGDLARVRHKFLDLMKQYVAFDRSWIETSRSLEASVVDRVDAVQERYSERMVSSRKLDAWLESFLGKEQVLVVAIDDVDVVDRSLTWDILWHLHGPMANPRIIYLVCVEPTQVWEITELTFLNGFGVAPSPAPASWHIDLTRRPIPKPFSADARESRPESETTRAAIYGARQFLYKVFPPALRVSAEYYFPRHKLSFRGTFQRCVADYLERYNTEGHLFYWKNNKGEPEPARLAWILPRTPRQLENFLYALRDLESNRPRESVGASDGEGVSGSLRLLAEIARAWQVTPPADADLTRRLSHLAYRLAGSSNLEGRLVDFLLSTTHRGDDPGKRLGKYLALLHDDLSWIGFLRPFRADVLRSVLPILDPRQWESRWLEALWDVCLRDVKSARLKLAKHWKPCRAGLSAGSVSVNDDVSGWMDEKSVSLEAFLRGAGECLPRSVRGLATLFLDIQRISSELPAPKAPAAGMNASSAARYCAWLYLWGLWRATTVASTGKRASAGYYQSDWWKKHRDLDHAVISLELQLRSALTFSEAEALRTFLSHPRFVTLLSPEARKVAEQLSGVSSLG